jgi:mannose-1-phosphate guanylyltransferase
MNYAVIMAGGSGTRLWPLSRQSRPKQVLDIFGNKSLLVKSFERLLPVLPPERIFIQTNKQHTAIVRQNLPLLPPENIISEPVMRNTAGAIALAAAVITAKDPQASMVVVTADHIIEPVERFAATIAKALEFVNRNPESLVTFGINPTHPSTQYGYVHLARPVMFNGSADTVFKVSSFREKPDLETARQYVESGSYYWNSGMFVWKAAKILREVYANVPGSAEPLSKIAAAVGTGQFEAVMDKEFIKVPKISIDYAVMEVSTEVYALKMDCSWFDMGSYHALVDVLSKDNNGNSLSAPETEFIACKDNIIISNSGDGHLVAAIGLEGMVVAHSADVTFICPVGQIGRIKEMIEHIEKTRNGKYL